jgi:hypothetical protein
VDPTRTGCSFGRKFLREDLGTVRNEAGTLTTYLTHHWHQLGDIARPGNNRYRQRRSTNVLGIRQNDYPHRRYGVLSPRHLRCEHAVVVWGRREILLQVTEGDYGKLQ